MKTLIYFFLALVLFSSCEKRVIQTPSKNEKDTFIQKSKEREKARQEKEYKDLQAWVDKNPQLNLEFTNYGYWMSSPNKNSTYKIKDLDFVQFVKQYKNLDKQTIYSFKDNGLQSIILGKTDEIRGVENALKSLSEGDSATLLLPSFMAYGLYGDENKIGAHQPILVEVEVLKVKKYK